MRNDLLNNFHRARELWRVYPRIDKGIGRGNSHH